jgi:membrane protease YdiL (CAAX protease family)
MSQSTTIWRALELLILFGGIPAAMKWGPLPRSPIPILVLGAALCGWVLWRDPSFDRARLWNAAGFQSQTWAVLLSPIASAPLLFALVWWLARDQTFLLPRQQPALWLLILIAYPLLSVYPQELLYRAFFFHRYAAILPTPAWRIAASAAAFSFGHVFFRVPLVAMPLTLIGGALFAYHYEVTGSLLAASIEHALYGDLIFTIGLGRYFFHRG